MNTLLAILKATEARRDVILEDGLNHRFPFLTFLLQSPWWHLKVPNRPM